MSPFASRRSASVAALGELKLIAAIGRWLGDASPPPPAGLGDDCAVLPAGAGRRLITVDPVVYGRHFDRKVPPAAVGAKLLKRNLSDIAAMGGSPEAAVISLLLDRKVSTAWLESFYRGLAACARKYRVRVVGGDIAEAPGVLAATLTLVGSAGKRVLARRGARAGDAIYVTGVLGGSLASGHHHAFTPRLAEGAWLAGRREVRAMMDVSDGLAKDLPALNPRGAFADLAVDALPRRSGASDSSVLSEGEDYELLFALAARADAGAFERAWRRRFPRTRLTRIGRFLKAGPGAAGCTPSWGSYHGYEHLR
ncbi:MAG TPA: thiamine-phosphate kinase [Opitutaceae bacterium]|jgi:thiamine-monophosphate kinase|nr:thiamine-phosphate kinase [Opitutaceae bacterium]